MAEALMRLHQQGVDCVLPSGVIDPRPPVDGRSSVYSHQSTVDISLNHQLARASVNCPNNGNQPLFVVIARSEYDTMRQELAGLKQSFCELKSTVDREIRQLRSEGRLIKHVSCCNCSVWDGRSYTNASAVNQSQQQSEQLTASHPAFSNSCFTGLLPSTSLSASVYSSQSELSDNGDHGKLVQLLPTYDIWVNKMNLQIVLNEAPSRKDGAVLFVLRRIIPIVFAWEELACSRGQGLNSKTTDDMFGKVPLDPTKVAACKAFMRKFCVDNGYPEPAERSINQTFSHQVNYARRRLRITGTPSHSYLSPVKLKKLCSLSAEKLNKERCCKVDSESPSFDNNLQ